MKAYWLYYLATKLVPLLPERLGYWLFARLGDLAFLFGSKARARYLNNLDHVLGPDENAGVRKKIARQAFQNLMKNYYDLFCSHRLSPERLRGQLQQLVGFEHFEAALAEGRGCVAGSAHMGNFNLFILLAGLYLGEHRQVLVPVERLEPERLYELLKRQRASQGVELVPVDQAARPIIKTLRAGNIVGLALDLDVTRTGPVVTFFGHPAQLPDGAAALALKFQVPIVLGFARRLPNNRCVAEIEPPLRLQSTGDLARDTRAGVEQIARILEKWICKYPEQWIMFEPVWKSDN